jgi:cystathionine beta-lyase/cystathionine gamma-synthase
VKGDPKDLGFSTRAVHAGQPPDPATGSVTVPIYQTSTYVHEELGHHKGYEYARVQNPTRFALENNLASLERGVSGHAFASGMAATQALMSLLSSGDHAVVSRTVYGGTFRLFTQVLDRCGLRFSWVDGTDPEAVRGAMTERTRMVFMETPTNPTMEIVDLAATAEIAHAGDALLVVDNTFLSPYLQRPLELGADVVVHSTTKFLNGHSDSIGGALVAARREQSEWFYFVQKSAGAILSPFDSFLTLRGIKTLAVRLDRQEANARALVEWLRGQPAVRRILYPGLPEHPGHAVHRRQARGFGSMISLELADESSARRVLDRVRVFSLAESLGGVESLISHPVTMTHASLPAPERTKIGLGASLIRLSVGLEDLEDLRADLEAALEGL